MNHNGRNHLFAIRDRTIVVELANALIGLVFSFGPGYQAG
jgi:hypothetical protein